MRQTCREERPSDHHIKRNWDREEQPYDHNQDQRPHTKGQPGDQLLRQQHCDQRAKKACQQHQRHGHFHDVPQVFEEPLPNSQDRRAKWVGGRFALRQFIDTPRRGFLKFRWGNFGLRQQTTDQRHSNQDHHQTERNLGHGHIERQQ